MSHHYLETDEDPFFKMLRLERSEKESQAELVKYRHLLNKASEEIDVAWREVEFQEERNANNTAAYCYKIEMLERKVEKALYISNLWIQGLLGIMTPTQRAQSLGVCSSIISEGLATKGWESIDEEVESDNFQLEQSFDARPED
jgi:hypothetical protein